MKPLSLETPYPEAEGLSPDAYSLRIISPAYASPTGELNAVLQYIYHSYFFRRNKKIDEAKTLVGIAISEMKHLELLGETILALGAPPVYCQNPYSCFSFYSAKYVAYSRSLKDMIVDDMLGERHAISSYSGMLKRLQSERVKEIIARIAEDEKLHLARLEEIYKTL